MDRNRPSVNSSYQLLRHGLVFVPLVFLFLFFFCPLLSIFRLSLAPEGQLNLASFVEIATSSYYRDTLMVHSLAGCPFHIPDNRIGTAGGICICSLSVSWQIHISFAGNVGLCTTHRCGRCCVHCFDWPAGDTQYDTHGLAEPQFAAHYA